MSARVLVTGEYFCDLVFGDLDAAPAAGREVFGSGPLLVPGGTFNIAAGLARVGLPVAWACEFGTDPFSAIVRGRALAAGVDPVAFLDVDGPMPRISAAFSVDGDRGFLSASDAPVRPVPSDLRPEWAVQTFRYTDAWIDSAAALAVGGTHLFGTCRDCDARLEDPSVAALLGTLTVFAPSEPEALRLTGARDAEAALAKLAAHVPVVVITRGAEGALVAEGDRVTCVPGHHVPVVDTIGAGDAFVCGWMAATLAGLPVPARARAGCLFGAMAVTRAGGGDPHTGPQILRFAETIGAVPEAALVALLEDGAPGAQPEEQAEPARE